jgi:DNA invertase Pin-like site-specific DNA recombinase
VSRITVRFAGEPITRMFTHEWSVWEKASGAQSERRELLRLLKAVATGDVVTVTRIDRLAR